MFKIRSLFQYWEIPLVTVFVWYGMLIALLACWSFEGHPIYWFMTGYQFPVYISDIGATSLQPIFISCSGFQGIFFVLTLIAERWLRYKRKLLPNTLKIQVIFASCSIVAACISMLGILFTSIFNTNSFDHVHFAMVSIFIGFAFLVCALNTINYLLLWKYSYRDEMINLFNCYKVNRFAFSFWCKLIWVAFAAAFAIAFGAAMEEDHDSISSCFEWTLSFWYGILLCIYAIDLSPIIKRNEIINNKEKLFYQENLEKNNRVVSTFGLGADFDYYWNSDCPSSSSADSNTETYQHSHC